MGNRMFALYRDCDYDGVLAAVDAGLELLDADDVPTATFWRICLPTRVGRLEDAIAAMEAALDQGWWYGESQLRGDPDLKPLHGRDDWEALVSESIRRQQAATPDASTTLPCVTGLLPDLQGFGACDSVTLVGAE